MIDQQENREQKIDEIAQAIISAISPSQEAEKDSSLKIFLTKLYKNNTSPKPKRMNSIRLNRFCAFLFKVAKSFPRNAGANTIIQQSIFATILNQKNFQEEEDDETIASISRWIARIIEETAILKFFDTAMSYLRYFLYDTRPSLLSLSNFEDLLRESSYFQQMDLTSNDERESFVEVVNFNITNNLNIPQQVVRELKIERIYSLLFRGYEDRKEVINFIVRHLLLVSPYVSSKYALFQSAILSQPVQSSEGVQRVLEGLQHSMFDRETCIKAVNALISKQKDINILVNVQLRGLKVEQIYLQIFYELFKDVPIELLVRSFAISKVCSSYIPFYLIINSEKTVPKSEIYLLFDEDTFTERRALIVSLSILHNSQSKMYKELLEKYLKNESKLTVKRKTLILKAIQFALTPGNRAALYTNIIKLLPFKNFNEESNLEFLPFSDSRADKIDSEDKKKLITILERHSEETDDYIRLKIDLFATCGNQMPLTSKVKYLSQIFEKPIEEIVKILSSLKEDHLLPALMCLNNKLETAFIEEPWAATVEFIIQAYKNYSQQFEYRMSQVLQSRGESGREGFFHAVALYNFHTQKNLQASCDPAILNILSKDYTRVEGLNFSEYFIHEQKAEKCKKQYSMTIFAKKCLCELRKLMKHLGVFQKNLSIDKKQLKALFEEEAVFIHAFRVLDQYFEKQIKMPLLLTEIFSTFKSEYYFFETVQKQFAAINEEYIDVLNYIPELLKNIYPETINFLARLIQSQPMAKKEKAKFKKKKNQKTQPVVSTNSYIFQNQALFQLIKKRKQIGSLFGEPIKLENYDNLFKILSKIPDQESQIPILLNQWLPKIKIFHCETYVEWTTKINSYCDMWRTILISRMDIIDKSQLQRHFLILTDLFNTLCEKYKGEADALEVEEKILMTLLFIYQASLRDIMDVEENEIPAQEVKNVLMGFKVPNPQNQVYYYQCYTCHHSVCQICASFIHKNHDRIYTGKDGTCSHDSSQKKKNDGKNIFTGNQSHNFFQAAMSVRNERREQARDEFFSRMDNWDYAGEDDFQMIQHRRQREEMAFRQMVEQRHLRERQLLEQQHIQQQIQLQMKLSQQDSQVDLKEEDESEEKKELDQIKSQSEKSIKNMDFYMEPRCVFEPEFNPADQKKVVNVSSINSLPLSRILIRELQTEAIESTTGKNELKSLNLAIKIELQKQRYIFFNKSNYFRTVGPRNEYSYGRPFGIPQSKRNILTTNKKFLIFPSVSNGILILSMTNIVNKFIRRQTSKSYNEPEQERNYLVNSINNSNMHYQPLQLTFSRANPNLFAVIGHNQFGFFPITNDGKIQRMIDCDANRTQNISKFSWPSKNRNIFACSSGNSIRIGHINESNAIKVVNRFRIQIQKQIRDFEINIESGALVAYIIDNDGVLYRSEFDYREGKPLNITDKKVPGINKSGHLQSLIVVDNKILLSNTTGGITLLKLEGKNLFPSFLTSYDLEQAFKQRQDIKNIRGHFYLSNYRIIHENQMSFSIACLIKRPVGFGAEMRMKKSSGFFAILRFTSGNLEVLNLSEDEVVESYQVFELSQSSFLIILAEQTGTVWCFRYSVPENLLKFKEDLRIVVNETQIPQCNRLIKMGRIFKSIRYFQPKRYYEFKESRDITSTVVVALNEDYTIKIHQSFPHKYFITGITFNVQLVSNHPTLFDFQLLDEKYSFFIEGTRDIHIPLNLKETLEIYCLEEDIEIIFSSTIQLVKNCKVYGVDFQQDSSYKKAYCHLYKLVTTYYGYDPSSVQNYLENKDRVNIGKLKLTNYEKLKETHKYTNKELNLLLKLQLLAQSIPHSSLKFCQKDLEELLHSIKSYLLPISQKRHYLEISCCKLVRNITNLFPNEINKRVGHPLEWRTVLDFYYFQRIYYTWNLNKNIHSFQNLITYLYTRIFKRVTNLYLIYKLYPNLIYQLTYYYKNVLSGTKHHSKSGQSNADSSMLNKIVGICSNFVALVVEYYQTLKNSTLENKMVNQDEDQQFKSPEKIVLDLLEEVFCATKKQLYREIFISPELYLQKLYLQQKRYHTITSAVRIFDIHLNDDNLKDHASRKDSFNQQGHLAEDESDIELEEESQKEMLEEEAREMVGDQVQKLKISQLKFQDIKQEPSQKQISQNFRRINNILSSYLINSRQSEELKFTYYQFSFQMATALFKIPKYLNQSNAVFYIGFLFNLLRIIEMNINYDRDRQYIRAFFKAVHESMNSPSHSILFMVLNYFFEPQYSTKMAEKTRNINMSMTKLSRELLHYYKIENINIIDLFLKFKVTKIGKSVTMSEAMKFIQIDIENQTYQLKFLGNLYLNLKKFGHEDFKNPSPLLKNYVLSNVVKYNVRVFTNIMLYENWKGDEEGAKVEVGFEKLQENPQQGVDLLYDCATKNQRIFIQNLQESTSKIQKLEEILHQKGVDESKVLEILTIFYDG